MCISSLIYAAQISYFRPMATTNYNYSEDHIRTLDWIEHMRMRPGMYNGKLGDGSSKDDGIYVLLKEVIDNSIDEHVMGYGKTIEVKIENGVVSVRDFGRGIPLGKVVECVHCGCRGCSG